MDLSNNYDSFRKAWDLLSFFKFPKSAEVKKDDSDEIPPDVIVYFPAVGAFIGFAAYCGAWILEKLMHGKIFSAMLSAVVITLGLEVLTLGKDLAILMSFIKVNAKKLDHEEAFAVMEEKEEVACSISDLVLLFAFFILKMICIGILIYSDNSLWLVVMLAMAYLVQGLTAAVSASASGESLLPVERDTVKTAWIVAAAISIVAGFKFIPAVILALIITWLFFDRFLHFWMERYKVITGKTVGLSGIIIEYILLVVGTILLARQ